MAEQSKQIFCRPTQAPDLFGVSRSTFYRWVKEGGIKIIKRRNVSLVRVADVVRFLDRMGD